MSKTKTTRKARRAAPVRKRKAREPAKCRHICADFDRTHYRFGRIVATGSYALYVGDDWNFGYGGLAIIHGARCITCKAQLSIGPSSDIDTPLGELVAAEVGQSPEIWARWLNCDREIDRALDDMGVRGTFGLGASNSAGSHLDPQPPVQWTSRDIGDYLAGWLALRIAESHLEQDEGWPWDPARPIADQQPCATHPTAGRYADGECAECVFDRLVDEPAPVCMTADAAISDLSRPSALGAEDLAVHDAAANLDARFDDGDLEAVLPDEVAR